MCKDHTPSHLSRGWLHPLGYSCRSCCVIHPASVPLFTLLPSPARSLLPPPLTAPLFPNLHSPSSLFPKLMTLLLNALKTYAVKDAWYSTCHRSGHVKMMRCRERWNSLILAWLNGANLSLIVSPNSSTVCCQLMLQYL